MRFTEAEVRFLRGQHGRLPSLDSVQLGNISERHYTMILERRAKILGTEFEHFRASERAAFSYGHSKAQSDADEVKAKIESLL